MAVHAAFQDYADKLKQELIDFMKYRYKGNSEMTEEKINNQVRLYLMDRFNHV